MRTKQQWLEGLHQMRRNVYLHGGKVDRDDESMIGPLNIIGATFDLAHMPEHAEVMTATSHLSGERINRFCHVHQSREDLHKKQDMTRLLCQHVGGCTQRCMGTDALNAISCASYEADKGNKGATQYYQNFLQWLDRFQRQDLVGCCAQTDVKGDRTRRPSQQVDPDLYLRVVENKSDGIVVRGCKIHITVAPQADEILVVPTRALQPDEKDWAVSFAVPGDWEGVKLVVRATNQRPRRHFPKGFLQGTTEAMVIFDDAFIPWERVFLCGEAQHGGVLALLFALYHRHSYSGCKPAVSELLMGTVALAAEYNGVERERHVRDKLANMILVSELAYAAGFTASEKGAPQVFMPGKGVVPYGPGTYIPDSIYCNVGRCLSGEAYYHELETLADISGGAPSTIPYEEDWVNPEITGLLEKYTQRNPSISPDNQQRLWRHVGDILCSAYGGVMAVAAVHGGGSPIMEKIAITSQYDIGRRKEMVKRLAGIDDAKNPAAKGAQK
ncbi:MAG: 4-hydroxyphenylacetate 3-hydroxylase N-terminal domain-containing protein [Thermodesulfobacteriota bacterium]